MPYTVIAEYDNERQATIAAGMLINNNIDAHVEGSNMTTLYGAGATWAPVRLLVPDEMAERAAQLLAEHGDR